MQISIRDDISPDLERILRGLKNRRPLMRAAAQAAKDEMRAHYNRQPPNKRGFPSNNFWRDEGARKVSITSYDNDQATIVVDSVAMGHRFFGGTITPKRGRALSIPLSPEAYKTGSASLWTGPKLTLIERPGKPPLLVDTNNKNRWTIHYVLLPRVTHAPDQRAFPERGAVSAAVGRVIREKLSVILTPFHSGSTIVWSARLRTRD